MDHTVLLHPQDGKGFVTTVPALPGCSGVGKSREQALENVRTAIAQMMTQVEVVRVSVEPPAGAQAPPPDPWLGLVGQFRDDPAFDPMMRDVYRERSGEYPG